MLYFYYFFFLRVARHQKCQWSQFLKTLSYCQLHQFLPAFLLALYLTALCWPRLRAVSAFLWGSAARGGGAVHGAEPQRGAVAEGSPRGAMDSAILPPAKEAHLFIECETGLLVIHSSLLHMPDLL